MADQDRVEKLMTLTRAEFIASLAGLDPSARLGNDDTAVVCLDGTSARLSFEALPQRRLGGLLSLPQARITIDLTGLTEPQRVAIVRRFDIAFQRGGG